MVLKHPLLPLFHLEWCGTTWRCGTARRVHVALVVSLFFLSCPSSLSGDCKKQVSLLVVVNIRHTHAPTNCIVLTKRKVHVFMF